MRRLTLALVMIMPISQTAWSNLLFIKNGIVAFEIRNNGSATFPKGYLNYQSGSITGGETGFSYQGVPKSRTRTDGTFLVAGIVRPATPPPGTGLRFSYSGTTMAEAATNGDFFSRAGLFQLWVKSITFNWDQAYSNNDALNIRQDLNTEVQYPEYNTDPLYNAPAAYTRNLATPQIVVTFGMQPAVDGTIKIQGISTDVGGALSNTYSSDVTFSGGQSSPTPFTMQLPTPDRIMKTQEYWDWDVIEGGASMPMTNTGPHTIYTLLGLPLSPWSTLAGHTYNPWVSALDFAIDPSKGNAHNTATQMDATSAITNYIHWNYGLTYETQGGRPFYSTSTGSFLHLQAYMTKMYGSIVNCYDQAAALTALTTLIGIPSMYLYMDPYGYLNPTHLLGIPGLCNNPFFDGYGLPDEYKVPLVDVDDAGRTWFRNHAFVEMNSSVIFDACGGPFLGSADRQGFIDATIDQSTQAESQEAGTISKIGVKSLLTLD
jgi:hypothetical protein